VRALTKVMHLGALLRLTQGGGLAISEFRGAGNRAGKTLILAKRHREEVILAPLESADQKPAALAGLWLVPKNLFASKGWPAAAHFPL